MGKRTRPMKNFQKLEEIGRGAFGTVWKYRNRKTGQEVAVKEIQLQSTNQKQRDSLIKSFDKEVKYLNLLSHKNVLKLQFSFETKRIGCLVLDLMAASLKDLLKDSPDGFELSMAQHWVFQLLKAVNHCHERNIVHRDVKPGNLLLSLAGRLKLADFGMAARIHGDERTLTRRVGTVPYMAPEIILGLKYGSLVDIWSTGIVFSELLHGDNIFKSRKPHQVLGKVFNVIGSPVEVKWPSFFAEYNGDKTFSSPIKEQKLKKVFPKLAENFSAVKVTKMLLTGCHWIRPTAREILDSPFFKK